VDLFINVSESEGIPVSIMEALSAGIPVIATNVGGTNEIVNNDVGFLIDKEFEINTAVNIINNYLNSPIE
ncbi:MAG: glycosyltransferase, partial [Bacteroidetes bacterium]|nr:glycosyltransferase [Bacteroidota bacterium]